MSYARPFRLAVVYEFAGQREHMMHALLLELGTLLPGLRVTPVAGLFLAYRQGGFRPARLINLVWVYVRAAVYLAFCRPDAVLVHTSPPGIQLWTAFWARMGKVPAYCWFMDYHPEIEARALERKGQARMARLLQWIDARLLPTFSGIVTLDPAMTATIREKAPNVAVLEHPPWAVDAPTVTGQGSLRPARGNGPLRLAYTGNLGLTHDLEPLARLLEGVRKRREIAFLVIGASPTGEERFRELGARLGASVEAHPRVPVFSDLGRLYRHKQVDAGIVVLSAESAGLVSPSKFVGYINFGLPIVYVGPDGTNTATVCRVFEGGFWLLPQATLEEIERLASELIDPKCLDDAARGALVAAAHFGGFNAHTLASGLADWLGRPRSGTVARAATSE